MADFLKAHPFITIEQYMWELTIPQIRLMVHDATRIIYLNEEQAKKYKARKNSVRIDDPMQLLNDCGAPIFGKPKKEKR